MLKEKLCVKLRTGGTVILDFKNKHEVAMYFDIFSRDISRLQEKLLRPGDIFVDCGANIGYFTFFAAPLVTKKGRVIAIDANPYCADRLKESQIAGHHDNVEIKNIAVGESAKQLNFFVASDPMYSSLSDTDKLAWTNTKKTITVNAELLDNIFNNVLSEPELKIRLLKLDVEGAEVSAMLGAEKLLKAKKIDYIHVELHPIQLEQTEYDVNRFHAIMKKHGYHKNKTKNPEICIYSSPKVSVLSR